jgi:hypothetical protein
MSWTTEDLAKLRSAYAEGTLQVRFADGRMVTYPSAADLLSRIQTVEAALAQQASGKPRAMTRLTTFARD